MSRNAILLVVILAGTLAGQSKNYTPPRTPDGQPDLQGVWTNVTITPLERPANLAGKEFFTAAEARQYEKETVERRARIITLTPEQQRKHIEFRRARGLRSRERH